MITYQDVNKALSEVVAYLKSTENVWNETRKLKLYDVSYHAAEIIDKYPLVKETYSWDDLFSWYCESSYEQFEEWMNENNITDERKYIGHTSSFYLTDLHDGDMRGVIETLFDKLSYYYIGVDIDDECKMIEYSDTDNYTEEEQIEENQADMEYISSGEFLEDVKKYLHDAIEIADYIDSFMKNQINDFTEYIECQNEGLEEQKEQEEQAEREFSEKYNEAIRTMTATISGIIHTTGCTLSDVRHIVNNSIELVTV